MYLILHRLVGVRCYGIVQKYFRGREDRQICALHVLFKCKNQMFITLYMFYGLVVQKCDITWENAKLAGIW